MHILLPIFLLLFLISLGSFIYVLTHERRSMWSGMTLVFTLFSLLLVFAALLDLIEDRHPEAHDLIIQVVIWLIIFLILAVAFFIIGITIMFIYNGIVMIKKEGTRLTNFLSLGFGIGIIFLVCVYPFLNSFHRITWLNFVHAFFTVTILYLIGLLMMYTLTSLINSVNFTKNRFDYIVVLGAGLIGEKVSPLLAGRIKRGIEIYRLNPGAKMIMTGGQGPQEEIPEGEAMADYAIEQGIPFEDIIVERKARNTAQNIAFSHELMKPNSKFCLVTNYFHLYRALVLAKRQGLDCVGYGVRTKWYFTLNAFIREFIAYLVITKKLQLRVVGSFALIDLIAAIIYMRFFAQLVYRFKIRFNCCI